MTRILMILVPLILQATSSMASTESIPIDTRKSRITWTGRKLTGAHSGTVVISKGTLGLRNGIPHGGSVTIDMKSIKNIDIENTEWRRKLENRLKSDSFFDVEKHPIAQMELNQITADGSRKGKYRITGNLMVKGVTHPVEFDAVLKDGVLTASLSIDRSKWNIRHNSARFFGVAALGDQLILDDIELEVTVYLDVK